MNAVLKSNDDAPECPPAIGGCTCQCHCVPGVKHRSGPCCFEDNRSNEPFGVPGTIYLAHFETPFKHAQHYLGFTAGTLEARFKRHCANAASGKRQGSALMNAITRAGIPFKVVRTWPGDRAMERRFHDGGNNAAKCPVCTGKVTYEKALCLLEIDKRSRPR